MVGGKCVDSAAIPGLGHNNGPTMEPGQAWRAHCWGKARRDLLPRLPIEVVRYRLKRAREIGLDYKVYATVRASTGRDIVAFLFSTNALRLFRQDQALEAARAERLGMMRGVERKALTVAPLLPEGLLERIRAHHGAVLDAACAGPVLLGSWSDTAAALDRARGGKVPADAVLLVGDTGIERDWVAAGRLAGYLASDRFFARPNAD